MKFAPRFRYLWLSLMAAESQTVFVSVAVPIFVVALTLGIQLCFSIFLIFLLCFLLILKFLFFFIFI